MHPAALPIDELLKQCTTRHSRRGGPGGQHRNKVETAVLLLHGPTGLRAEANERRSQAQNRHQAIFRLRLRLALEVRQPPASLLSELWRSRLDGQRLPISAIHDDFPALLAEALDRFSAAEYDVVSVAEQLQISMSQLVKLLKKEPKSLAAVNRQRKERGLALLR
jgi:peptide chain release factor-like protein